MSIYLPWINACLAYISIRAFNEELGNLNTWTCHCLLLVQYRVSYHAVLKVYYIFFLNDTLLCSYPPDESFNVYEQNDDPCIPAGIYISGKCSMPSWKVEWEWRIYRVSSKTVCTCSLFVNCASHAGPIIKWSIYFFSWIKIDAKNGITLKNWFKDSWEILI